MAATVLDLPAPAGPANNSAAPRATTAPACSGTTPRKRSANASTGPST